MFSRQGTPVSFAKYSDISMQRLPCSIQKRRTSSSGDERVRLSLSLIHISGDTASFQYTAVFDDDSDVKERIGHVVMKKENGKWLVDSFVTKSVTKAD